MCSFKRKLLCGIFSFEVHICLNKFTRKKIFIVSTLYYMSPLKGLELKTVSSSEIHKFRERFFIYLRRLGRWILYGLFEIFFQNHWWKGYFICGSFVCFMQWNGLWFQINLALFNLGIYKNRTFIRNVWRLFYSSQVGDI